MPFTVLIPHATAERCYLSEALLWLVVNRFPLDSTTENRLDAREDPKYVDGLQPYLPGIEPLQDDECARIGLPPDPAFEELLSNDYHLAPDDIRKLLQIDSLEESDREKLGRVVS